MTTSYASDPTWADIVPLPQDDGENPLAQIAYTDEYAEAMSYLRAVMAKEEFSDRVLAVTEHIIDMNPAHYTVWLYRAKTLFALQKPLSNEIDFLNSIALRHEKNYQIWHHRQLIIDAIDSPQGETQFIRQMFDKDAKNYHVWSYRQWLVKRFDLWDHGELEYVEELLQRDIRNNSAWNHRFFVVFGRGGEVEDSIVERDITFAEDAIFIAPQNPSPWNYLRGVLTKAKRPITSAESLCKHYAPLDNPDKILSSHALDMLAEAYAAKAEKKDDAVKALELLARRFDPIRAGYWGWRVGLIRAEA
ncbi:CAAX geranylgeranyltransferase alpha subunit [Rhizina undulata]